MGCNKMTQAYKQGPLLLSPVQSQQNQPFEYDLRLVKDGLANTTGD